MSVMEDSSKQLLNVGQSYDSTLQTSANQQSKELGESKAFLAMSQRLDSPSSCMRVQRNNIQLTQQVDLHEIPSIQKINKATLNNSSIVSLKAKIHFNHQQNRSLAVERPFKQNQFTDRLVESQDFIINSETKNSSLRDLSERLTNKKYLQSKAVLAEGELEPQFHLHGGHTRIEQNLNHSIARAKVIDMRYR